MTKKNEVLGRELVIIRELNAPRELVFKAFSESEKLAQWWGPKGCDIIVKQLDFRVGGIFHYCMKMGDMPEMWGRFIYHEINAPERIVFINSFSDEEGGITRAPFAGTWPLEMLNVLTLTEKNGKTILTLQVSAFNASVEEIATFEGGFESMQQGFGATFDQLETLLAKS